MGKMVRMEKVMALKKWQKANILVFFKLIKIRVMRIK